MFLVTGGTGLVGSAIKNIQDNYPDFHFHFLGSKECNLLDFTECDLLFKKIKPNYVIHLAANVGGLYKNMSQKIEMLEDNLSINSNVIKCAKKYNIEKLIACLSTCIFPDNLPGTLIESMLHDGPPHTSNAEYSHAKRMLVVQCETYNIQYGTNYFCIIPTNIYGFNDNFNLEDSHVIPGLIHRCYLAKESGIPFVVKGTGKPLRQFIYSSDIANLVIKLLLSDCRENVTLSPTEEFSIGDIATMIAKSMDYSGNIVFNSSYSDGKYKKTCDNSKLLKLFPNFEFIDITNGIDQTVKWFIDNYQIVRK